MTEYQKTKIPEMRLQGMGYKAIGNVLGLSRDVVRCFCRKYGLEGNAEVVRDNIEVRVENGVLCAHCSLPLKIQTTGRKRRFCSEECRRSWWKNNADKSARKDTALYKAVCAFCKKEFESYGNSTRKYCCHECYIKDRFGGRENGIQKTEN